MPSEKIICPKCGLYCGFLQHIGATTTVPSFPDHCFHKDTKLWSDASDEDFANCPVAQMIEKLAPGSFQVARQVRKQSKSAPAVNDTMLKEAFTAFSQVPLEPPVRPLEWSKRPQTEMRSNDER